MHKLELASKVCEMLRESGARKPVSIPKQQFTITDEAGNSRVFNVKRADKEVLYTMDDVKRIIDVLVDVIVDTIKHGEPISLKKIGTLHIHYRAARKTRIPGTSKWVDIPAHYVPKLEYSSALLEAARIYESYKRETGDPLVINKKGTVGRPRKKNTEEVQELMDFLGSGLEYEEKDFEIEYQDDEPDNESDNAEAVEEGA